MYNLQSGVTSNTVVSDTVTYDIPSAYQGGSVYLNTLPWNDGGYADIFMTRNDDLADELFVTRINAHQHASNGTNGPNDHDGVRVDCAASGYSNFSQVRIRVRKGVFRIMGPACTKEVDRPVAALSIVHSDNVIGNPRSPTLG